MTLPSTARSRWAIVLGAAALTSALVSSGSPATATVADTATPSDSSVPVEQTSVETLAAEDTPLTSGDVAEYVVLYEPGSNMAAEAHELVLDDEIAVDDVFTEVVPAVTIDATTEAVEELAQNPAVVAIEPNREFSLTATQSGVSWNLDRIDQPTFPLNSTYTYPDSAGQGVDVYVVDTGVMSNHVEFDNRVASGYSSINDERGTSDCHGHGTHVAGTVAGSRWGVAKKATIVPVRVLGCDGAGYLSDIVQSLNWIASVADGPSVVNMSLGGAGSSPTLDTAISNLVKRQIPVVVAAGNSNDDACWYTPASTPSALTVAATDSSDTRAYFSNYGSCVDIFAPGVGITAAYPTSTQSLASMNGTSMAAPHVAGVVALILGGDPGASPSDIRSSLVSSAVINAVVDPGVSSPNTLLQVPRIALPPAEFSKMATEFTIGATTVSRTSTTLSWEPAQGALRYEVCLSKSTSCPNRSWISTTRTSHSVSRLSDNTTYYWWVRAVNRYGTTFADSMEPSSFRVSLPKITVGSLPTGFTNTSYSVTLTASGGIAPFTWSASSLPAGLRIDGALLTGTPTKAGTTRFVLTATDATGSKVTKSMTLRVARLASSGFARSSLTPR